MNILLVNFNGTYGLGRIIYLISALVLFFVGWFLVLKFAKTEKSKKLVVKITGLVLFVLILWNRISITIYNFMNNDEGIRNLLQLIPLSFCGTASLLNAIATLFLKKDNKILHCVSYYGLIGGIITMFYPTFLNEQDFFDARTVSGLLHHTVMVWLIITNMITGNFRPRANQWYVYPIGLCIMMTVGLFFHEAFGLNAMQINEPLLSSAPVITSWYVLGPSTLIIHFAIICLFEKFVYKKKTNEIFNRDNWF